MDVFSRALALINNEKAYTVFIDDTGSNNLDVKGVVRNIGVIVDPKLSKEIPRAISLALKSLNKTVKAIEFHFSDIYQGQGEFRGVDYKLRLEIIRRFVDLFSRVVKPAIFVQSMDPKTAEIIFQDDSVPSNSSFEDLAKMYAFSGLIARIHEYLKETIATDKQAVIFCDHGFKKSGTVLVLPFKLDTIYRNSIFFIDSKQHPGIQLADFAAFVLNRHQILFQREKLGKKLSDKDITFMLETQPLIPLFQNTTNFERKAEFNPQFHLSHTLKEQIDKYGKRITIIGDTRTGSIVVAKPKDKLKKQN